MAYLSLKHGEAPNTAAPMDAATVAPLFARPLPQFQAQDSVSAFITIVLDQQHPSGGAPPAPGSTFAPASISLHGQGGLVGPSGHGTSEQLGALLSIGRAGSSPAPASALEVWAGLVSDPMLLHGLLQMLGLVSLTHANHVLRPVSRMWHLVTAAAPAMLDSPRGRCGGHGGGHIDIRVRGRERGRATRLAEKSGSEGREGFGCGFGVYLLVSCI